ncbi:30S ribosomal protein S6 [Candidatus Parcubacteria bacterium]|nr:30S ribosomal protein S6 [Candidatus Parcubacteria bacterium]
MIYETTFLFLPTLSSEDLAVQVGKLKEIITSNGGEIISDEYPQMVSLAYTLRHRLENKYTNYDTANLGWVKYNLDPEAAPKVKKQADLIKSLLRYLTLKTVSENTMISKNVFAMLQGKEIFAAAPKEYKKPVAPVVEEGEMVKEEVDEELDKMLDDSEEVAEDEAKETKEESGS